MHPTPLSKTGQAVNLAGIQGSNTSPQSKISSIAQCIESLHHLAYDIFYAQKEIADQLLGVCPQTEGKTSEGIGSPGALYQLEDSINSIRATLEKARQEQLRFNGILN